MNSSSISVALHVVDARLYFDHSMIELTGDRHDSSSVDSRYYMNFSEIKYAYLFISLE